MARYRSGCLAVAEGLCQWESRALTDHKLTSLRRDVTGDETRIQHFTSTTKLGAATPQIGQEANVYSDTIGKVVATFFWTRPVR